MTLTGFVFDSSGNPVSGATVQGYVSADNATTTAEASTTTNSNGKWSISTSTAARIPMDVKITFGDSVRWLKAGDSINVSKLTLTDTLTVGEDDEGFDVIFYGATASANMTWDASEDDLILSGAARIVVPEGQLVLGSAAVSSTAAELNILDGVTATASELNLLDGDTSVGGSITIADTDGFVVNDGGTMKTIPASDISTYVAASVGDITAVSLTGDSGGALSVASGTAGFTLTGGTGIDTSGSGTTITFSLDLNELTAAAVNVANDSIVLIDADDSNASKKESVADFVSGIASTGLTASSGTLSVNASQAITALTGGDLTIYEDANNADVSFKMGTSATESLTIQVLNGGSNKTAEEIHFSTATASGTANHGKMVFDIDGTDQMEINDSGVSITGDLTISGDDLFMNTNTAGHILVGDDTNYNPVAVSGDVTLASNGAITIANDAVESGMLNDNIISGQTEISSGLADADELLYSDGGVLKRVGLDTLSTKVLTGNAASATILATARAINGVDFDGSAAITVTAAGSTLSDTVTVAKGGTNATSFADKAVIITQDSGTDTLAAAAMSTNGQLLIGGTSGPAVATLTAGTGISISNSDGGITVTNSSPSAATALDDIGVGDSASTLATSAGDITIDAQGNDTDIIFKGTDGSADTTFLTLDGSDAGKALFNADVQVGDDLFLNTDSSVINMGAGNDVTFTHDGTTGLTIAANPITLDSGADITFDAAGNDFSFQSGGTEVLKITNSSSDVIIKPVVDEKDIIFQQRDGTEVARVEDNGTFNIVTDKLAINGTAVTSTAAELNILDGVTSTAAELNILDGVTATASELNLLDGGTSVGSSITVVDADGFVVNDGGTMKTIPASAVKTYAGGSGSIYTLDNEFSLTGSTSHFFNADFAENADYFMTISIAQQNQAGVPYPYIEFYRDTSGTDTWNGTSRFVSQTHGYDEDTFTGAPGAKITLTGADAQYSGVHPTQSGTPGYFGQFYFHTPRNHSGTNQETDYKCFQGTAGWYDYAGRYRNVQIWCGFGSNGSDGIKSFLIEAASEYPDTDGGKGGSTHSSNNVTSGFEGVVRVFKIDHS